MRRCNVDADVPDDCVALLVWGGPADCVTFLV